MRVPVKEHESYSSEMLRYMPVGLVVVGAAGSVEFVNHQFEVVSGWTHSDFADAASMWRKICADAQQAAQLQQRLQAAQASSASSTSMPAVDVVLRCKSGAQLSMEVSARVLPGRVLWSFVDVSQRKAAEAEIRWLGFYDALTQLPNRRLLQERLQEALLRSRSAQGPGWGALLLLDIDNFKALNETWGHQRGDAVLRLVAARLSECIAGRHTLARQGGDEFAVVLEALPDAAMAAGQAAEQVALSILEAMRTPFWLEGQACYLTVSIGAVLFSARGDSVEDLLKHADVALYQAKNTGRDTLQFFDPRMQQAVSARVELENDLRLALERGEFDLFFQPQVQHDTVVGAEALLRWKHPSKGYIAPSIFIPAAEASGLILPLGEWVLYAACRQLALWAQDPVLAGLSMSVNVSPRQFYQPYFVEQVQQALRATGARASQLELELTEGLLLADVEDTIRKMVQLKAIGVMFSLDDFGTGYSSLGYLKRLPLDKLKIDQSFVSEVCSSSNDAAIARSIIALGNSLGLKVVAEGVETEGQRAFLVGNGCHDWQGFYFSRPLPAAAFAQWVHAYAQQFATLQPPSPGLTPLQMR